MMDGSGAFGAVGALQGVAKPITVALRLLEESAQGPLLLGRIPPLYVCMYNYCTLVFVGVVCLSFFCLLVCLVIWCSLLVGEGAKVWAKEHSISTCCQDGLITGLIT